MRLVLHPNMYQRLPCLRRSKWWFQPTWNLKNISHKWIISPGTGKKKNSETTTSRWCFTPVSMICNVTFCDSPVHSYLLGPQKSNVTPTRTCRVLFSHSTNQIFKQSSSVLSKMHPQKTKHNPIPLPPKPSKVHIRRDMPSQTCTYPWRVVTFLFGNSAPRWWFGMMGQIVSGKMGGLVWISDQFPMDLSTLPETNMAMEHPNFM